MTTTLYDSPDDVTTTYTQPTVTPTAKVKAVGVAGAATTSVAMIVYVLSLFHVVVPVDISDAAVQLIAAVVALVSLVQTIVTFAAGYLKKSDTANGAKK